jgi:hypothetical protein
VKYAARDYPSIFDSLLRRLKIVYANIYNDFATTVQGIMLMDMIAYACDGLQWYLDRTASDCYLRTSRTRAAASMLTEQIGYKMAPAAAAGTTERLTFPDGSPAGFTITARWRFQGPNSMQYESFADTIVPGALAPGDTLDIPIRQGQSRLLTFTADGAKNQTYRMTGVSEGQYVAENSVQVWVDGSEWDEYAFLEFEKTNHFEVSYLADPPLVRFGDGSAGNVPPLGAEVKIRYLVIEGANGNAKVDTIQTSIDKLTVLGQTVNFTVTNPEGATGGTDPEDIDQAKRLAPFYFAARGAAITQQDYETLSASFSDPSYGSVAKSYAFNPRSSYDDVVFNSYIDDITSLLTTYRATVTALEVAISDAAASITPLLSQQTTDLTALEAMRTTMVGYAGAAQTAVATARGESEKVQAYGAQAVSTLGGVDTAIDNLINAVNASGTIPSGDQAWIVADLNDIKSDVAYANNQSQNAATSGGVAKNASDTALGQLSPLYELVYETAPVAPDETMYSLIESVQSGTDDITTAIGDLQTDVAAMEGAAEDLEDDIEPILSDMHTRIGALFSDDCMSNYVQVPILALDIEGNYVSPSVGLTIALQTYLDGIKEVTQQVEVVDGGLILLPADIVVKFSVLEGAVAAEVDSAIRKTIVGMLKGRSFNQPLYLDALYDNAKASSSGIKYLNVEITGPTGVVPYPFDSEGNLVGQPYNVIVLGTLTTIQV